MKFASAYDYVVVPEKEFDFDYSWEYFDEETGELRKGEVNQHSQLQSQRFLTPQEIVERGIPNVGEGIYGDIADVPTDVVGLMDYIRNLQDRLAVAEGQGPDGTVKEITKTSDKDSAAAGGLAAPEPEVKGVE